MYMSKVQLKLNDLVARVEVLGIASYNVGIRLNLICIHCDLQVYHFNVQYLFYLSLSILSCKLNTENFYFLHFIDEKIEVQKY